jgi:hypothetical protein
MCTASANQKVTSDFFQKCKKKHPPGWKQTDFLSCPNLTTPKGGSNPERGWFSFWDEAEARGSSGVSQLPYTTQLHRLTSYLGGRRESCGIYALFGRADGAVAERPFRGLAMLEVRGDLGRHLAAKQAIRSTDS